MDTTVYSSSDSSTTFLSQKINSKTSQDLLFSDTIGSLYVTDDSKINILVPLDCIENDLYIETKKLIPYQEIYNLSPFDIQFKWGFSTNLRNSISNLMIQFGSDVFPSSRQIGILYREKVIRENRPVYLLGKFFRSDDKIEFTTKDVECSSVSTTKNAAIAKQNASSLVCKIIGFTSLVISISSALAVGYLYKSEVSAQNILKNKL